MPKKAVSTPNPLVVALRKRVVSAEPPSAEYICLVGALAVAFTFALALPLAVFRVCEEPGISVESGDKSDDGLSAYTPNRRLGSIFPLTSTSSSQPRDRRRIR
eukprot:CAMPEP_0206452978 /NCGR_PEP_ID=MMETSP0324_2-20121206/20262_1 /ASSEMBLY_ACC=CAM_ASM_000836 /TAXON_ID=2866 /ORGANISM="Crypthecodinium cohnii, Strain Seligo" /LENGTH=102 /DNA_ID=CAMNT_0053923161 /DNA_START=290 /DNA_END=595 /DNA_ORIENTATION=-